MRKSLKNLILTCLFGAMMVPATSFAWLHDDYNRFDYFATSYDEVFFIDNETVKINDNMAEAWVIRYNRKKNAECVIKVKFDYNSELISMKNRIAYDRNGRTITEFTDDILHDNWKQVMPCTIGEKLAKIFKALKDED